MALTIIVRNKLKSRGRSDHDKILRKEGWGGSMTEEQADKCEFLERMAKKEGVDKETSFRGNQIDGVQ
jgi:hypothetical protein